MASFNAFSLDEEILPEILALLGNMAKCPPDCALTPRVKYSSSNRGFAITVLGKIVSISEGITSHFADQYDFYFIYKAYYLSCFGVLFTHRAVIDFCVCQKSLLSYWLPSEASVYNHLLSLIVPLLAFPRLEIASLALTALPTLFPDISRNDNNCIK